MTTGNPSSTTEWVAPLAVSLGAALVLTPAARRIALRSGLVDWPSGYKAHRRPRPYLGGVAIALSVIAARLVHAPTRTGAIVTGLAAVLVIVGLVDDDRALPPLPRFVLEAACAVGAVAAGLRIVGTGVPNFDVALTVLLLVGITNASNLMDNLDGLAAGVTAAGAGGVCVLASLGGESHTTVAAASLVGACLAFLVFNARPASIFMGDAGSLFLGFLLAAVAIQAGRPLPEPANVLVPLLVVALPAADTATVVVARIRHGRSPFVGGRDHLSHRLAGTGIGPGPAVAVLVGVEAALSGLAVAVGRGYVPTGYATAGAAVLLVVVVTIAARVRVYPSGTEPARLPRWLAWGFPAAVIVLGALAAPAALQMLRAHNSALAGAAELEDAVAAAHSGEIRTTSADLAVAQTDLARAHAELSGPLVSLGLGYPALSTNLRAARTIIDTSLSLARSGSQLVTAYQSFSDWVHNGAVAVDAIERAQPGLDAAARLVDKSNTQIARLARAYLVPQLLRATNRLQGSLGTARSELDAASAAATYLPPLLGADGKRQYFLAIQNPDESRGTGGLIGNWGIVTAESGHLQLTQFGRLEQLDPPSGVVRRLNAPADYVARYGVFDPAQTWQNVNMSPDFPTVGQVIAGLYPQSGGTKVDGVIGVDPAGLAALLALTGPVRVAGWPVPISASNVQTVTLYNAYLVYTGEDQRATFLGDIASAAVAAFSRLQISAPSQLLTVLGPAIAERHIQVYSDHPSEESFLTQTGLGGSMPAVQSGSLAITTQNVAANKIDYYLDRTIDYHVTLTPTRPPGGVGSPVTGQSNDHMTLQLHNKAPSSGLPASLIGPYDQQFQAGEEASFVSIYTPLYFESVTLNGAPAALTSGTEVGRKVYSDFLDIPAGGTASLDVQLVGQVTLLSGGWYELDLPHQPVTNPDHVTVTIDLASGWRVAGVRGGTQVGPRTVEASFAQVSERSVWVQVAAG